VQSALQAEAAAVLEEFPVRGVPERGAGGELGGGPAQVLAIESLTDVDGSP
jgi:hypothetical protein